MNIETEIKSILKTHQLDIGYANKLIAKNISVEINTGNLIAVIGVNGSGKSTLLKTLTGDLSPKKGEIYLQQKNITELNTAQLSHFISVVLTDTQFSHNLNVEELVALGRQPYTNWLGQLSKNDKLEINKALQLLEIEEKSLSKCSDLSDGQLQKVLLARAIAQNTPLIFLDEPTTHLDLYHKIFVFKLLKKLTRQTEKAIVFATHEINLALQLCDQIILVNKGEIIQKTPEELIKSNLLQELFPKDLVAFDASSKSFRVL
ncbi:iron complex transport system ATP-binding protein [Mesonia phycicola]|uniref:Iron complex transport system ATP-binding protein n=1 Tax=Mesonia phycicola TaxID=579105 RepID=A0A1M6BRA9_9FLAO|nr:ABC transporter ATP-binding protein [Mesonia phycicola]SHI51231.1 iron complex transport system ATP-binding protein [Mesonia phycicola]